MPKHRAQLTNRALGAERYHVQVLLRAIAAPLLTLTLLVAGISAPPAAQAPQGALRILSREGVRPLPTVTLNTQEYVALEELSQAFGLTSREDQLAGGVTVTAGNDRSSSRPINRSSRSAAGSSRSTARRPGRAIDGWCRSTSCRARSDPPSRRASTFAARRAC